MNTRPLTLLVVEDEPELVGIYCAYGQEVFSRVLMARSLAEAETFLKQEEIDCYLLDNLLPDGKAIDLIKQSQFREERIPTIIITGSPYTELAIDAVNYGVHFFLQKPVGKEDLLKVFRECESFIRNKRRLTEWEALFTLSEKAQASFRDNYRITNRELELISLALMNLDNKSIADKLFISIETVRKHFENIFKKLQINSKKELRELAHRHHGE